MRFAVLLLVTSNAMGAVYYVDTTNSAASDLNAGSQALPWKTIGKAVSIAAAGDTVNIQPGTYAESMVLSPRSGTAGSPITFAGVRGAAGSWLTTIDGSTAYTTGWAAAPEIGSGVFKQTAVPFNPGEVTIDNKRLAFVYSMGDISTEVTNTYTNATIVGILTGTNLLALATNVTLYTSESKSPIYSWDAVEAMWGSLANGGGTWTLYLRLRDGSSPNGRSVKVIAANTKAIDFGGNHFLTVSNLAVVNPYYSVWMDGTGCYSNTLASNYFCGGYKAVYLQGGAHNNLVIGNDITGNYYGYDDPGAWDYSTTPVPYGYVERENLYEISKRIMGQSTSRYNGISVYSAGNSNIIASNHIYKSIGVAIELQGVPWFTNALVYGNTVRGHSSVGITVSEGEVGTQIFDNCIYDNNINFRVMNLNEDGDSNRLVYIYRNCSWLPALVGDHIFTWSLVSGISNEQANFWFYNNSFSGGVGALRDNSMAKNNGGLTGFHYLNNVFSGTLYVDPNSWGVWMWTNPAVMGAFDYNDVAPFTTTYLYTTNAAWYGAHNVTNSTPIWSTNTVPNFYLPWRSEAINAGLDIPATYSALPQDATTKIGSGWDMGRYELGTAIVSGKFPAVSANALRFQ